MAQEQVRGAASVRTWHGEEPQQLVGLQLQGTKDDEGLRDKRQRQRKLFGAFGEPEGPEHVGTSTS